MSLSAKDIAEFNAYLATLTPRQVIDALYKERKAGRTAYAALALAEARRRGWPL